VAYDRFVHFGQLTFCVSIDLSTGSRGESGGLTESRGSAGFGECESGEVQSLLGIHCLI